MLTFHSYIEGLGYVICAIGALHWPTLPTLGPRNRSRGLIHFSMCNLVLLAASIGVSILTF